MLDILFYAFCSAAGWLAGNKLKKTFAPSFYKDDWYQWATNQMAHMLLGLFFVVNTMFGNYIAQGELAYKWVVFVGIAIGYLIFEIKQGGVWNDIAEDFVFVVIYGAGITLYNFDAIGGSIAQSSIIDTFWTFYIPVVHLIIGILYRLRNASKVQP